MISRRELERYERQIIVPGWGRKGQIKLKKAEVTVVGAGGLGSAVLTYLAVAGVGKIRIIDRDTVELGNLNRQMLYTDADIGRKKAESARDRLLALNPDIEVEAICDEVTAENVYDLTAGFPVIDALDNLPARYLLNKAAIKKKLLLIHGAVHGFEGRATTIIPGETPCLKCLYQAVLPGKTPVAGVTPGVIGCIQASELIKYVLGIGELLTNRLLVYDGLNMSFREVKLKRNPDCRECNEC